MPERKGAQVNFRINSQLKAEMLTATAEDLVTVSFLLDKLIREYLQNRKEVSR